MESVIFVVSVIDCAYKIPSLTIAYSGINMHKAYTNYYNSVECSDRTQVIFRYDARWAHK